jgi:hypothetical protein
VAAPLALLLLVVAMHSDLRGYALNRTVADKRHPANAALGACPQLNRFDTQTPGKLIDRRWNTALGANIHTVAAGNARLDEVEQVIEESFTVWTSVTGTTLAPSRLALLTRTITANACSSSDGQNSICFAQSAAFAPGVLAFTNTVTSDILGEQFPPSAPPSVFIGEVLDADILFNPVSSFSTPQALPTNSMTFDLESVLIHELGHFFGFSHSAVWGAMMYPFAPTPGQFVGSRPTQGSPDAPLSDDDRTGLRVLYPDAGDALHVGSIRGRITPANPLSLAGQPASVTGIFGAHVVAIDEATGSVAAAALSGWSCSGAGPAIFNGSYAIERLPVGRSYRVVVEPLDGPVSPSHVLGATQTLCRNASTDPGWPAQFACTVPPAYTGFTTRSRQ